MGYKPPLLKYAAPISSSNRCAKHIRFLSTRDTGLKGMKIGDVFMQKRITYPAMNKRKTGDDAGGVAGAQQGKKSGNLLVNGMNFAKTNQWNDE